MLGNWKNEDKNFINLKLTATAWETDISPVFTVLGADFKETAETYSQVKWKLIKINPTFTPAKGKMGDIYWFKAFLEDGDEMYVVESTITNASKDLLNALLVNIGIVLSISLYLNKRSYPTASVKLEDWNWAQTAFEFSALDNKALYEKMVEIQEPKVVKVEDEWEATAENMPF